MALRLVKVDPGMYGVKAGCDGERFYVKSLVDSIDNVATSNGYRVKVFGNDYIVGNDSIAFDFNVDKHKLPTKILTNLAVSQLVEDGDEVNLVIGMPVEHWLDRERREKYEKFIASSTQMSIVNNDKTSPFKFTIKHVTAVPETIGHIARHKKYKKMTVGVIDCGGGNIQGAIYKNSIPIRESCFTLNEGGYFYLNSIKIAINAKFGLNYQDYQIEELVQNGTRHEKKAAIMAEVKRVTKLHFMKVIRECRARNWNLDDMEIIVVGGAAQLFKEIIVELLPNATISDEAMWDNMEGFGVLGEAVYRNGR